MKTPEVFIDVEFEPGGKRYQYRSPVLLHIGQLVLVNVYGQPRAAKVLELNGRPTYAGTIKSIIGVGYLLEDLEVQQYPIEEEPPTLVDRILGRY